MPWAQTSIRSIGRVDGGGALRIGVIFTDGTRTYQETYQLTNKPSGNWIGPLVTATIQRLNDLDAEEAKLTIGQPVNVTPDAVKPPTQEELDRQAWLAARQAWQVAVKELAAGVGTTTQSDVDDAVQAWKALPYLDEYGVFL